MNKIKAIIRNKNSEKQKVKLFNFEKDQNIDVEYEQLEDEIKDLIKSLNGEKHWLHIMAYSESGELPSTIEFNLKKGGKKYTYPLNCKSYQFSVFPKNQVEIPFGSEYLDGNLEFAFNLKPYDALELTIYIGRKGIK